MKNSIFNLSDICQNSYAKPRRCKNYAKLFLSVTFATLRLCVPLLLFSQPLFAQGYGGPLTFQGLDRTVLHSAGSSAMGGISVGIRGDVGLMFQNPAALTSLSGLQISAGGTHLSTDVEQEQNYAPVRYYPNLSVLLENLTAQIPDPDSTRLGFTPQDSVQRAFDTIGPNWSRSSNRGAPQQAMLATPLTSGSFKIVAGVGVVEYANLDHYYQNNNVLSPTILSQRPLPTLRPSDGDPLHVEWSQALRSRDGAMQGYGIAVAGKIEKYNLSIGLSGLILQGSSDDFEQQTGRGRLTFYSNAFRAESLPRTITKTGTSDFRGEELTLSSILSGRYLSIGFAMKLPMTITRKYNIQVATDSAGTSAISTMQGEEQLKLPWRGTVGLALTPREKLTFGFEYEFRPYDSVKFVDVQGNESSPWLSASVFRIGGEYRLTPWLALRGGMRGSAEVFQAEGNYIDGEPVTYTVYSAGVGVLISGFHVNATYENTSTKYQDVWASAISKNSEKRHVLAAQIIYELPWLSQ